MRYFVSRQIVWPDGTPVVEIAGCFDMAGPDMLVPNFKSAGEGREFKDPREAAQVAIRVRDLWWAEKDKSRHLEDWDLIEIRYQSSYLAVSVDAIEPDAALLEWAERRFEKIRKCAECGDPIYDEKNAFYPEGCYGDEDFLCCREYCAEKHNQGDDDAERIADDQHH